MTDVLDMLVFWNEEGKNEEVESLCSNPAQPFPHLITLGSINCGTQPRGTQEKNCVKNWVGAGLSSECVCGVLYWLVTEVGRCTLNMVLPFHRLCPGLCRKES